MKSLIVTVLVALGMCVAATRVEAGNCSGFFCQQPQAVVLQQVQPQYRQQVVLQQVQPVYRQQVVVQRHFQPVRQAVVVQPFNRQQQVIVQRRGLLGLRQTVVVR